LKKPEAKMLKEYILPAGFHCPECGSGTAFAAIIDASPADSPIVCNECGFEYGNVGALRLAMKRENSRNKSERDTSQQLNP
jgi:transcription elongation factor Elf1